MVQLFNAFGVDVFKLGFQIVNFLLLLYLLNRFLFPRVREMLADRSDRIREGIENAEQARRDREQAEAERAATLQDARREANEILARAQRLAQESRAADIAATRQELERIRDRASADLEAEKQRAIAELRAEVADLALAAAGKVVGETMTTDRERRLVEEFLSSSSSGRGSGA